MLLLSCAFCCLQGGNCGIKLVMYLRRHRGRREDKGKERLKKNVTQWFLGKLIFHLKSSSALPSWRMWCLHWEWPFDIAYLLLACQNWSNYSWSVQGRIGSDPKQAGLVEGVSTHGKGWNWMVFEVSSTPNHWCRDSALWFCTIRCLHSSEAQNQWQKSEGRQERSWLVCWAWKMLHKLPMHIKVQLYLPISLLPFLLRWGSIAEFIGSFHVLLV